MFAGSRDPFVSPTRLCVHDVDFGSFTRWWLELDSFYLCMCCYHCHNEHALFSFMFRRQCNNLVTFNMVSKWHFKAECVWDGHMKCEQINYEFIFAGLGVV